MDKNGKKPIIEIKDMSLIFNQGKPNEARGLDGINLEIYPEEYVIIFGPSGCGKSTLLYSIAGFERVTSGEIRVFGQDLNSMTKADVVDYHREKIGMVFQQFYLVPTLSIIDNVCLPRVFAEEELDSRREKGMRLLKRFGIDAQADKYVSELSGGQKQRVAIARSLVNDPNLIIADEPVGNLDSKSSYNVMSILDELNRVDKKTVVLVTHDPSHLTLGDRVVYMRDGKIIRIEEVYDRTGPRLPSEEEMKEQEMLRREWESFKQGKLGEAWELFKKGELEKDWEIVKKEQMKQAWLVFKNQMKGEGKWDLGKDWELIKKDELAKRETISPEIKMLMRSFKNFSIDQLGMLMIPFKAQQLLTHVFFGVPDDEVDMIKKKLQEVLSARININDLENEIDLPKERGGVGWDKRLAHRLIEGVKRIQGQAAKINFAKIDDTARDLARYLVGMHETHVRDSQLNRIALFVKERLSNKISMIEMVDNLDRPFQKGGVGLDRRTAQNMARELEILLLVRFAS